MTGRARPVRAAAVPPICRALRAAREASGISCRALAGKVGVAQSMMSRYETTSEPMLDMIRRIEQALRLPKGELLRAAGYVGENGSASVAYAVRHDGRLDSRGRAVLLAVYREMAR